MATLFDRDETRIETITPAKAEQYLKKNTTNRRVRQGWVDTLAEIIKAGKWRCTHQGIAFNCDGTLIDGQHRLMAIVHAGTSVKVRVTRGLAREDSFAIDQNKVRDVIDIAGTLGIGLDLNKPMVAIARVMMAGFGADGFKTYVFTNEEVLAFIQAHLEAISFAAGLSLGDCKHATIRAVIARAWYTCDRNRLVEFAGVLRTLVAGPGDQAAAVFARAFLNFEHRSSISARAEIYAKCESALRAFLARKPYTKSCEVNAEQFPIPTR